MSTKLYLILSTALICAFMAMIYVATDSRVEKTITEQTVKQTPKPASHSVTSNKNKSAAKNCPQDIQAKKNGSTEKLAINNEKSLTILNLWYYLSNSTEKLTVSIDPRIKEVERIGVNTRILPMLKETDIIQLPIINGEKYLLHVKNITTRKNVKVEIYGEVRYRNSIYSSTITLVDNSLYGLLSTPSGDYDIRMADDKGYLYKSGQLDGAANFKSAESIIDLPSFLD